MDIKWQETTLRKGTKRPKICRDMYITDSRRETWRIATVKNGKVATCVIIDEYIAATYINKFCLKPVSAIFNGCYTYRTSASNELIQDALAAYRQT